MIALMLILLIVFAAVYFTLTSGTHGFSVFSLVEHKKHPDRLSDLLPWALLVAPDVVMNKSGALMAVFKYRGPDLFSATNHELISISARLNDAFKRLNGGWAIYAEDARVRSVEYPEANFPYAATQLLDLERQHMFKDVAYHENEYHLTLVYLPAPEVNSKVGQLFYEGDERKTKRHDEFLRQFQREAGRIANLLQNTLPEMQRLNTDDLLTYLHSCVSLKKHPVKMPQVPMYLDAYLADTPMTGGLDPKLGDDWIQCLTVCGFPVESQPGLLDAMNQLPFEYRWVTRFIFLDKPDALKEIKRYQQKWLSLRKSLVQLIRESIFGQESAIENTDAVNKSQDANVAGQILGSDAVAFGYFTQTIVLFDKDRDRLDQKKLAVEQIIDGLGFTTIDENQNHNAVDAFLGSIPGNCANNVRHPLLHTLNLVHLFPLSAVWAGDKGDNNLNGDPSMQVVTSGNTPFRLSLNYGDVGHTLIVGPTGSGKSTLLCALEAGWTRYPGAQVVIFDMKQGSRILTKSVGGDFYDLGSPDCKLAFQPLADIASHTGTVVDGKSIYAPNEAEMAWAEEWLTALCEQEGLVITPERKNAIRTALKNLADSPLEHRHITGFKQKVQDREIKSAITAFTHEGAYGHILDSDHDYLTDSPWQAFEMRTLVKDFQKAVMPTMTYLFHKLEKRFKADKPTIFILDEGWLFLDNPVFAPKINEYLRTLRSLKVYVVFASQSPSSVATSPLFPVINESCYIKIFLPFAGALDEENAKFYRMFSLNQRQIEIIAKAIPKREYYYTSPKGNRLFSLALSEIGLAYCTATGEEDIAGAAHLFNLPTADFNTEYLKLKGLDWAIMYNRTRIAIALALLPLLAVAQDTHLVPALPGADPAQLQPSGTVPDLTALEQQRADAAKKINEAQKALDQLSYTNKNAGSMPAIVGVSNTPAPSNEPIVLSASPAKAKRAPTRDDVAALEKKLAVMRSQVRVNKASDDSTLRADKAVFQRAKVVFPFLDSSVFEIHASPGHMTTIELQPGERITTQNGLPKGSDTVQWVITKAESGEGSEQTTLILVKPMIPDIQVDLMIPTNKRVYYVTARADSDAYMHMVGFTYPQDEAREIATQEREKAADENSKETLSIAPENIRFGYSISGPRVEWKPLRVFDDGTKTFVQMPPSMRSYEAPALFVIEELKEPILVNYRVKGDYYIVDRLFNEAQLRVGTKNVVKIKRDGRDNYSYGGQPSVGKGGVPHA